MKDRTTSEAWEKEFQEFMGANQVAPPKVLSEQIFSQVHADLNPASWWVFSKLALIHVVVGTLSLLFCPQFGLRFSEAMGLMGVLMRFGERACMLGCGAFFVAGTVFIASIVLRPEEVRVIRRTKLIQLPALGLVSMGAFLCTGANVALGLAAFWFLGLLLGGLATLELGWLIRSRRMQSA